MGNIIRTSCQKCGNSWEYKTGCGLMHGRLESIAKLFKEQAAMKIMEYAKQLPPVLYDFSYCPAHCIQCKKIISVPFLTIRGKETFTGECPICHNKVEPNQNIENMLCPVCHKPELTKKVIADWD